MKTFKSVLLMLALGSILAFGQTTTSTPITLPTSISVVGEFNQLATPQWAIGISALYAPSVQSNIGMYDTTSADVIPVRANDPVTKKPFIAISASIRQGVHEKILCSGKYCFFLGGDIGPGFSSNSTNGVSLSFTSSFVATSIYRIKPWLSFVVPIRMLYVSGIGWNPVLQAGFSFNLKALPPPAPDAIK